MRIRSEGGEGAGGVDNNGNQICEGMSPNLLYSFFCLFRYGKVKQGNLHKHARGNSDKYNRRKSTKHSRHWWVSRCTVNRTE